MANIEVGQRVCNSRIGDSQTLPRVISLTQNGILVAFAQWHVFFVIVLK